MAEVTTHTKTQSKLAGKVAIVTGASSGIGFQLLKSFASNGIKCVGCARSVSTIEQLSADLKNEVSGEITAFKCDLTREEEIKSLFEFAYSKYGGVDILVNNASVGFPAPLLSGETDQWKSMLDVNVLAICVCTREFYQRRVASGIDSGYIINMCGIAGHTVPDVAPFHFTCMCKHAVNTLTEGVRQELRENKSNIKVSQISPGMVKTGTAVAMFGGSDEDTRSAPIQSFSFLQTEDIAEAILYLLNAPAHVSVHDIIVYPI